MDYPIETFQHREARDALWSVLGGWRRFIIAVDGVDGAGKSTLARYLGWQLGMPVVATDMFLMPTSGTLKYREAELAAVIESRLEANRPVIVEGVTILRTLRTFGLGPDFLIWVEQENWSGTHTLAVRLARYFKEYRPAELANFIFKWGPA